MRQHALRHISDLMCNRPSNTLGTERRQGRAKPRRWSDNHQRTNRIQQKKTIKKFYYNDYYACKRGREHRARSQEV